MPGFSMPFQLLDFILIGIMLVSGILALARGFTREVLSLIAWAAAAVAAYFAIQQKQLLDLVTPYVDKPILAQIAVGAVAFIITLIIVSIISVKISDRVVDSSAGAFDRSLGFIYGLVRGLVLVSIAYLFYGWLQPPENQEDWIRNAQTLPIVQKVSDALVLVVGKISPDAAQNLSKTSISNPQGAVTPPAPGETGYSNGQTQGLDNLVEGQAQQTKPADGTNTNP
jgi:membrane protein required for colicin V production